MSTVKNFAPVMTISHDDGLKMTSLRVNMPFFNVLSFATEKAEHTSWRDQKAAWCPGMAEVKLPRDWKNYFVTRFSRDGITMQVQEEQVPQFYNERHIVTFNGHRGAMIELVEDFKVWHKQHVDFVDLTRECCEALHAPEVLSSWANRQPVDKTIASHIQKQLINGKIPRNDAWNLFTSFQDRCKTALKGR